jgi:D-alanine-D-alanine ligase
MKIVVLAGGLSTERNVSLSSGTKVCGALRARGHRAVLVDVFFGLEDYEGDLSALFEDLPPLEEVQVSAQAPDLEAIKASRKGDSKSLFGRHVLELCQMADMTFLALHGECGEDGRIQAAFDLLGIPYTGSGYRGSAVAMDKGMTKVMMAARGIRTPAWETITYEEQDIPAIAARTKVPCVVKAPKGGSSIGVVIVKEKEKLADALQSILQLDHTAVIEEYIQGREFTCGVLGDRALPSVEIVPQVEFYDYESKYQAGATKEICPGRSTPELEREIGEMALAVHRMLGLRTYSRCDFMVDENNVPWCLEVNTLPGMTPTSLVPQEAAAIGMSYDDLCEYILADAAKER